MPQRLSKQSEKVTIRPFKEDVDVLRTAYGKAGYNDIIRRLVARHVRRLEEATAKHLEERNG